MTNSGSKYGRGRHAASRDGLSEGAGVDPGSFDPGKPAATHVTFARTDAEQATLARRSEMEEHRFRTDPLESLTADVTALQGLHRRLFAGLCPSLPEAIGAYRGSGQGVMRQARRAVRTRGTLHGMRAADPCLEPDAVPDAMAELQHDIMVFWYRADKGAPHAALAGLTQRFFYVHPFLDGNGHVWRLILIALARRAGLSVATQWQVMQRPYGPEFSLALQRFDSDADLLIGQMRVYFPAPLPE